MLSPDPTPRVPSRSESKNSVDWLRQRAWVEVDLNALSHNVREIKRLISSETDLMAVVKADAYGHGAVSVAQTVLKTGASWLGVATIPEGIELRQAGITAPIVVLGATYTPEQICAIAQWQLQPTVCTPQQALVFSEILSDTDWVVPVHIKLDTGMSRLGAPWQQAAEFVKLIQGLPNLTIASIYSHLATADSLDQTVMRQQQARFQQAIRTIAQIQPKMPRLHFANSAATLTDPGLHYDMVRVGLGLYGLYPAPHLRHTCNLKPLMQIKARVTQVKTIEAGTGVSYGYRFIADRPLRIAVIGIGYADGVPRLLSNKMQVLIRGQQVRQLGAITMDQMMIDVSSVPNVQAGEVVTLLGSDGDYEITADDWANAIGTISWEILCGFKHRLPRVTVDQLEPLEKVARS
ncbi:MULTISPECIES: alanine racemase [Planktothricoides]|uniref:Alanine racemase n=2 Tax=Planktothricoides raciborskii TaxID=132608 RepID=A0AAU8JBF8_9CYAN|nr:MULTISPECIES: alanine racemase [Planktothricoides]KOR38489.1 alanine racemase [Planktothricoides sp. SR001]MBD2544550.1 alanine racemase [Planktothricoides raciborskii FACHB-1370]MBD2585556.1 alanine racemase [Planktothricoides raciborskii FACHB-1261]